ncbi:MULTISPECIES: hypothetical protein [unclassified Microcoleus]|nr:MULTISPECIES: hypothetical protein [unclassified Microcoleus]
MPAFLQLAIAIGKLIFTLSIKVFDCASPDRAIAGIKYICSNTLKL